MDQDSGSGEPGISTTDGMGCGGKGYTRVSKNGVSTRGHPTDLTIPVKRGPRGHDLFIPEGSSIIYDGGWGRDGVKMDLVCIHGRFPIGVSPYRIPSFVPDSDPGEGRTERSTYPVGLDQGDLPVLEASPGTTVLRDSTQDLRSPSPEVEPARRSNPGPPTRNFRGLSLFPIVTGSQSASSVPVGTGGEGTDVRPFDSGLLTPPVGRPRPRRPEAGDRFSTETLHLDRYGGRHWGPPVFPSPRVLPEGIRVQWYNLPDHS